MADEVEDTPQEGEENHQQRDEENAETFDADYVKKLRQEAAKYRTEAKANADAAKKLAEIEESKKSEADRAADALKTQSQRAETAEAALLRYEVAADKGVPPKAMRLLSGATREEIEASADDVLELIGDAGKPRTPKPNPAQREGDSPVEDKDAAARAFFGI